MKFRKKPVEVEAVRFDGMNCKEVGAFLGWRDLDHESGPQCEYGIVIPTLEGSITASVGDWIIRGVAGEFYPCKPEIFEQTYEAVS